MSTSVYAIHGPMYDHPSVTGMTNIMIQAGDLHGRLLPLDASPFLKYVEYPLLTWLLF